MEALGMRSAWRWGGFRQASQDSDHWNAWRLVACGASQAV